MKYIKTAAWAVVAIMVATGLYLHLGEWMDFGVRDYPSKAGKKVVVETAQNYGNIWAKSDRSRGLPTDYSTALGYVNVVGKHANEAEEIKERGLATAEGRTVPTNDVVGVSARQARWHDTGKVVFRGQMLEGYGEVKSSYIRHPIGPEGTAAIPSDLAEFKTYVEAVSHSNACPMYSLCGMVVDKNGNGQVFLIGRNGVSPATGRLYIVVNGAYKGPWGSDAELFWRMSDGDFQVRLAE